MARDITLEELQAKMANADASSVCEEALQELAQRMLRKVIKRTPVGQYRHRVGGTLRRGWKASDVVKTADDYEIEVYNPVEYAEYVEYGHRTANRKGWVEGQFMMTSSAEEIDAMTPDIVGVKIEKMMEEMF